ncbi:MAG TPA: hypothetical protein VGZ69_04525 [Candidatus Rhabdochlamydia sp.]|jgi:hypothetical protein|nr:hypothetical protein [Candidatus Rhabdochlamydia sp.]
METPKQIPETFSVVQAYVIAMLFFLELWPLVKPKVIEEEQKLGIYSLFFVLVCSGDSYFGEAPHAEWNEAIHRALHVPKEEQRKLQLSISEIFLCVLEFCKLYNERYDSKITYAVHLLESMKKKPENYKAEWVVWQDVCIQTVNKYMNSDSFDWSAELPT